MNFACSGQSRVIRKTAALRWRLNATRLFLPPMTALKQQVLPITNGSFLKAQLQGLGYQSTATRLFL
jgi:hypothetical protein